MALVRKGQSSSPIRLAVGWGLVFIAFIAIAQVVNGPDRVGDIDATYRSGGLVGALAGTPLEALLSPVGAVVIAIGIGIGGALLVTQTSLRTMATRTGQGVGNVARPMARAARQALRDLSSLSSDRDDREGGEVIDATVVAGEPRLLPPPTVYDAADDFEDRPPPRTPQAAPGGHRRVGRGDGAR